MDEWLSIDGNEEPWSRLLDLLRSEKAVSFVGAGASASLYPTWAALIGRLTDRAEALGVSRDDLFFWKESAATDPLETVESLVEVMGRGRYVATLRDIFQPPTEGRTYTEIHEGLLRLPFQAHVTTNYDLGLSEARGAVRGVNHPLPFTWRDDDVSRWLDSELLETGGLPILHAHGLIHDAASLILSGGAYREAYADGPWSQLFNQLWRQGSLVLVGFSLSDPWISVLADRALTAAGVRDVVAPGHVAILGLASSELNRARIRRKLFERRYHAQVLFYPVPETGTGDQDHRSLLRLLGAARKQIVEDSSSTAGPSRKPVVSRQDTPLDPFEGYCSWARERYCEIDLVGLGAAHLKLPLEEVYVPIRIEKKMQGHHSGAGETEPFLEDWSDLDVEQLFTNHEEKLVVIFGEPGTGKTTAIQKLHQLTLADAEGIGLAAGTLPVFLRLRHLTKEILGEPLEIFLESEIRLVSGDRHPGVGAELWRHGRLLLLFDGLDEIADELHRVEVCHELGRLLTAAPKNVRAVISCRNVGWSDAIKKTKLAEKVLPVEVRPFNDEQIGKLVEQWFLAAARVMPSYSPGQARTEARQLGAALEADKNQQFKSLIATPQLLTLLCVVVHQGGEIPRQRVEFFEKCVQVLLSWRRREDHRLPTEVGQALRVLAEIAWYMHANHRRDTLQEPQAAELIASVVPLEQVADVWHWLRYEAGLLRRFSERDYGFLHLHIQEYATALAIADDDERLAAACKDWSHDGGSWWQEVFQLLAALPGRATFAPLARNLLETEVPLKRADLLATCLEEASDPDLTPILGILRRREKDQQERDTALLRLLRGRKDPEVLELCRGLVSSGPASVRTEAAYVLELGTGVSQRDSHLALIHHPDDHAIAESLLRCFEQRGLRVYRPAEGRSWTAVAEIMAIVQRCQAIVLLAGSRPIEPRNLESLVRLSPVEIKRRVLKLAGSAPAEAHESFSDVPPIEVRGGGTRHFARAVRAYLYSLEPPVRPSKEPAAERSLGSPLRRVGHGTFSSPSRILSERQIAWEKKTGMAFLGVPTGCFEMGSEAWSFSRPIHPVKVSGFFLGSTPVTNRQYSAFLKATAHREPGFWRNRGFSSPLQPVVGVDWNDCVAFCRWLNAESEGFLRYSLPSEAQWEFAARGPENSKYPWGEEPPNERLASFASKDHPPQVGSFPAGVGPEGHFDLAGTVWEWCLDEWEPSYEDRAGAAVVLDPLGNGTPRRRPLRGGSWADNRVRLESAFRDWSKPERQSPRVGFRVAAAFW